MLFSLLITLSASLTCLGILRVEASPFPEPIGTMPSLTREPTKQLAISLIVPSPPHATTTSAPSLIDSCVRDEA